jgi:hypothetical protein
VLSCNGIWCPQPTANIKTLVALGYPVYTRLVTYRAKYSSSQSLVSGAKRPTAVSKLTATARYNPARPPGSSPETSPAQDP